MTSYFDYNIKKTIYFTLMERSTLVDSNYILEIKRKEQSYSKKEFMLKILTSNERFEQVEMMVVNDIDNEDLDDNTPFLLPGEYTYYVWQTEALKVQDADDKLLVETGIFIVNGDVETQISIPNWN
jgi:hypothetical protein